MASENAYAPNELMVAEAARQLGDGEVVFVGIGLPNLACNLARRLHAPKLVLIYESGAVGAEPERVPVSIGDPALVTGAVSVCSMFDVFYNYLQGGRIDVGFLQGAQIDRHGNLNTTVIGDYAHPQVRLPGSGGACEIAIHAKKVFVIAPQGKRSFPAELDFLTSPGHRPRGGDRARLGMPGAGPVRVITQLACYGFEDGEMILETLHPGVSLDEVRAHLGWEPRLARELGTTAPPSADELRLLRDELDPRGLYLGKGAA
jgi:glutaconate CoA-transferase subunit B